MSRVFNQIMPVPPANENKTIKNLLTTLGEEVELRPVYQRDINWNAEEMGELIRSVMCACFIPSILLYTLHEGDERAKESYEVEVVDGQHRFFTLYHYFHSKPVELPDKKPFLISLTYKNEDKSIVHIFYKETADTVAWASESGKKVVYMTEAEKKVFNTFDLNVRTIRSPLTLDQRRNLFITLQKGKPVRGSDLYKNKTEVPLVRFISETKRWEEPMKNAMLRCKLKAKKYWLAWAIRLFLIQGASNPEDRVKAFMTSDGRINEMIKKGCVELNTTPESEAAFDAAASRFFAFSNGLSPGTKITPTQFFVCFTHLLDSDEGREDIITSHMREWSTHGMSESQRKMWENRGFSLEERQDWFERSLDELESITTPAPKAGPRKNIPKDIRDAVWEREFGALGDGECAACQRVITADNWECAHITAHARGGKTVLDNLTPTCRACNRSMGTKNLHEYAAEWKESYAQMRGGSS